MTAEASRGGAVLAWRQLLRLGNLFTAASNVIAGFLIVQRDWQPVGVLPLMVAASALLYAAGMVLNDAFDATVDAQERPERPIPSGRIDRIVAFAVGWSLLGSGVAMALVAAVRSEQVAPATVAVCLAMTIVLYDAGLKNTPAGPWAMGWCRLLNVLLGASAAPRFQAATGIVWLYAAAIGVYTVILTYIARREAGDSVEHALRTRRLVKRMILGFIGIDAAAVTLAAGWQSGAAVLALLAPALPAARRAPMT